MDGQPPPVVPPGPPAVPPQVPPTGPPTLPPLPQRAIPWQNPPEPPKRRTGAWVMGGGIVLLCLAGASVLTWNYAQSRRISQRADSVEEKYRDAAGAFAADTEGSESADPNVAAERAALAGLFDRFTAAMATSDQATLADCFDAERLFREIERLGQMPSVPVTKRRQAAEALRNGLVRGMSTNPADYQWDRYEIRRIKPLDVPGEAVVYVRDWRPNGLSIKTRWWVKKRGGTWRFYDMEVLDAGIRMTTSASMLAADPNFNLAVLQRAVSDARAASQAIIAWDTVTAEKSLTSLDARQAALPPPIDAMRHVLWAQLRVQQKRPADALNHLDQAIGIQPDLPVSDLVRAWALNDLGRHDEALAAARKVLDTLGADAITYAHMGTAHLGLGNREEARAAFRSALADDVDLPDAWAGLCAVTTDGPGRVELARQFEKVTKPADVFLGAANLLVERDQRDALDTLLLLYKDKGAQDPWLAFYQAHALANREKFAEAAALLAEHIPLAPAESRAVFEDLRRNALLAAGDYVAAYQAQDDPAAAFMATASEATTRRDLDGLRALVAAHRARQPRDPWLHYFEAQGYRIEGNTDDALAALARGRLVAGDEEAQEAFRYEQAAMLFEAGQVMEAYRTVPPRDATFWQLAWACFAKGKSEDLARLLAEHRKAAPRDADLPMWEAHVAYLRRDYTEAALLYRKYRASAGAHARPVHDQLIRSLVRAGRHDEAKAEARAVYNERKDSYYLALAHLAAGEHDEAIPRLDTYLEEGGEPVDLYDDPDIGPLLRTEAMAAWRAKHPEPPPVQPAQVPPPVRDAAGGR